MSLISSHLLHSAFAVPCFAGAGMFVTTIVVGVVSFTSQSELTNRPFTRDVLFYLGAVTWTFITLYRETIDMKQSIGKWYSTPHHFPAEPFCSSCTLYAVDLKCAFTFVRSTCIAQGGQVLSVE